MQITFDTQVKTALIGLYLTLVERLSNTTLLVDNSGVGDCMLGLRPLVATAAKKSCQQPRKTDK